MLFANKFWRQILFSASQPTYHNLPGPPLPSHVSKETSKVPSWNQAMAQSIIPDRPVRVLVITMGGPRQEAMERMLTEVGGFAPPVFSPGVSSRDLRNRSRFFQLCQKAGLLPAHEWDGRLEHACTNPPADSHAFFDCLKDVPVMPGRRGSPDDVKLYYCVELWRKAKTINRGRSVLACILAHLIAMKTAVQQQQQDGQDGAFDVILEDNVRIPLQDGVAARRIRQTMAAIRQHETATEEAMHLKYFGWLGSRLNLQWNFECHLPSRRVSSDDDNEEDSLTPYPSAAPFPTSHQVEQDLESGRYTVNPECPEPIMANNDAGPGKAHTKPGGTPVWGAYAYWISKDAYDLVLNTLRNDVGSLLWKMKTARFYSVKPIDKILPRIVMGHYDCNKKSSNDGPCVSAVMITTQPAFFRAPMLASKIHAQWDPEFCKSTEYQLGQTNLTWSSLWLTESEWRIVQHHQETGEWITLAQLEASDQSA